LRRRAGLPGAEQWRDYGKSKTTYGCSEKHQGSGPTIKRRAARSVSKRQEAQVTTLSHSAHFVSWVFATVNFLNNAMLAIIFLAMEDFFRRRNSFECDRAVVPRFPGC
jgi:hypothetical protein